MPARKLTPEQVREIKEAIVAGVRGSVLSKKYHISGATICYIKQGRIWQNVDHMDLRPTVVTCECCKGRGMVTMEIAAKIRTVLPPPPPKPKPKSVTCSPPSRDRLLNALRRVHHQGAGQ